MIRYLSIAEVLELHERLLHASGGAAGIRDLGALESAVAQPRAALIAWVRAHIVPLADTRPG